MDMGVYLAYIGVQGSRSRSVAKGFWCYVWVDDVIGTKTFLGMPTRYTHL